MGQLVAPQRRLLRAAHQSARRSCEALWGTYIQLSEAEAAFRIHKSELSIRPIWHQREDRVLAHILVCFLAYVLWKTLEQWQSRAGLGNSPRILLQELAAITSTDVILPTAVLPAANCDCAASCAPIAPKPSCWSASVSDCRTTPHPRAARTM